MVAPVNVVRVNIWDAYVGALAWNPRRGCAAFEYAPEFLNGQWDLAPLMMPLGRARAGQAVFEFPGLARRTFMGLPGMLADSLPDRYGNRLIDAWLARQGRTPESFTPIERLCYTGSRGMGALEFKPAIDKSIDRSSTIDLDELVALAKAIVEERAEFRADLHAETEGLLKIIRVGTSAGGARPKAVIALNEKTHAVRSGQVAAPQGFDYWLLKFDGLDGSAAGVAPGYGRIEFAYYKMARAAGIDMSECRLLEEHGRAHFMSKRFDRTGSDGKLHLQSLCALAHFDFNEPGACSYEQAFQVMRAIRLPYVDAEQLFRRMVFNCVASNHDDHTKNIAFLMDRGGAWRLSPAFDMTFAFNPEGPWTSRHQMSINGKLDHIGREDFLAVAREMNIKAAPAIIQEVSDAVARWGTFAAEAGVSAQATREIGLTHTPLH